jgi:arylsulfatase A-like enzyme
MIRIAFITLALFLLPELAHAQEPRKKPNVIVIITDDQRWNAFSLAGHKHLKTPHIDRLGKEGVWFKNAFCTTSLCSPSRASILSGVYVHRHGVVNNFTEYPAWAYMHYPHGDGKLDRHKAELYHLPTDPEQVNNLIDDPKHAAKLAELQQELPRLIRAAGLEEDRMPLDEGLKQTLPDLKIR